MSDLFGLGAGTPSRFPYPDRPQPAPGLGPGSGQNIRARIVIVSGPAGTVSGVFVYTPGTTPGPGNPPVASMTASSTDPFGNPVKPDIAAYGAAGTFLAMVTTGPQARMQLGTGDAAEATPGQLLTGIFGAGAARTLISILEAPFVAGFPAQLAQVQAYSASVDGTGPPRAALVANDGINAGSLTQTPTLLTASTRVNAVGGTAASPTLITTDTWNPLGALAAGSGYTVNNGRFQLDNNGFIMVDVNLSAGAATVAGNYAFATALPAGQRPPFQCSYPLGYNGTVTTATNTLTLRISTAGTVTLQLPVLPNGTVVSATQRVPVS